MALVKLKAGLKDRTEILRVAENFKARVVDFDALIGLLKPFGITELVRRGKILMARGMDET